MPLALAYLAANLRKTGHDSSVIDALGEGIDHIGTSYAAHVSYRGLSDEQIVSRIAERPDGIGVSTMFSQDWPHVERTILAVHQRFPEVPIIVGGEHATAAADYILSSCPAVTMVAMGEGEQTIADFADWLEGRRALAEIAGVRYRGQDRTATNLHGLRIRCIDEIPWPAWDRFNLEPYFAAGEGHGVERGRAMPILATRGCPYQCTFCSSPQMWTTKYVMRSVPLVVDEIEHYIKNYKADNIDFFDLTAIIKRDWILAYCAEIKRRGLKFTWQLPSGTRSEAMDGEVLRAMAEAGCTNVTYAPESGSPKTLREIKKKVVLDRMFDSMKQGKRNGIFVKCNLIIGFPRETRWDMMQTVWCAVRLAILGVDDAALYPYSPYPGSELFAYLLQTGRIKKMDRDYFVSLMAFMDLKQSSNYCENVGPAEMAFYRLLGMGLFYFLQYATRPSRFLRTLRNYRAGRSDTVFEERLFGLLKRWRLEKRHGQERLAEGEART